jgi:hypothetical protein
MTVGTEIGIERMAGAERVLVGSFNRRVQGAIATVLDGECSIAAELIDQRPTDATLFARLFGKLARDQRKYAAPTGKYDRAFDPAGDSLRSANRRAHTRHPIGAGAIAAVLIAGRSRQKKLQVRENAMNKLSQLLVVGSLVVLGSGAPAFAAQSMAGTWTLNLEKSKFDPGPGPKSQTRTYADSADGTVLTFTGVGADGSAFSGQSTFKYDGKDYPITGSADYDTLSLKRVNGTTVKSLQKKDGKVVGRTIRTISGHGKVLTLDSRGKNASGKSYHYIAVYDKQ